MDDGNEQFLLRRSGMPKIESTTLCTYPAEPLQLIHDIWVLPPCSGDIGEIGGDTAPDMT